MSWFKRNNEKISQSTDGTEKAPATRYAEITGTNEANEKARNIGRVAFLELKAKESPVLSAHDGRTASAIGQDVSGEFPAVPRRIDIDLTDADVETHIPVQHPNTADTTELVDISQ